MSLKALLSQNSAQNKGASVCFGFTTTESGATDEDLRTMSHEDRIGFLLQFLATRGEWGEIIGAEVAERVKGRVMFTLTGDGHQFRCWHGVPGDVTRDHVDSCGAGLVFQVHGDQDVVRKYVDTLVPATTYFAMKGPDNSTFYIRHRP